MKRILKFLVFFLVPSAYLLVPGTTLAVCPVCTVAVAGGLGLSRYLGVDDTISGIWIGGLILSSSLWLIDWLKKKSPKFLILNFKLLIITLMYILVLVPLAWTDLIGHPFNTIWGIDKLIVGMAAGTMAFWISLLTDKKVRKIKGKQLFNFQKVIIPLSFLIVASLIVYFFVGYLK